MNFHEVNLPKIDNSKINKLLKFENTYFTKKINMTVYIQFTGAVVKCSSLLYSATSAASCSLRCTASVPTVPFVCVDSFLSEILI